MRSNIKWQLPRLALVWTPSPSPRSSVSCGVGAGWGTLPTLLMHLFHICPYCSRDWGWCNRFLKKYSTTWQTEFYLLLQLYEKNASAPCIVLCNDLRKTLISTEVSLCLCLLSTLFPTCQCTEERIWCDFLTGILFSSICFFLTFYYEKFQTCRKV